MKKKYIKPELDIYEFDTEDEITTSIVYEDGTNSVYNEHLTDSQQQTNMYDTEYFDDPDLWQ